MRDLVYLCYHVEDRPWRDELRKHLDPPCRRRGLAVWDAGDIRPGRHRDQEIEQARARAKVAVPLVTATFLHDDHLTQRELPSLLDASRRDELTLLWVPVGQALYDHTALAAVEPVWDRRRPLDGMRPAERAQAFTQICETILQSAPADPRPVAPTVPAPPPQPPDPQGRSRLEVLERLKALPAATFEELVFRCEAEDVLPGKHAPQAERAMELIRHCRSRGPATWEQLVRRLPA